MNREELKLLIAAHYAACVDHPWRSFPNYEVFRHSGNRKWFAVVMDVPKNKLGLRGAARLDVVNLKCAPAMVGSLLSERGFFPAYHMNKNSWITVALDGSVPNERLEMLLDMSYRATAPKAHDRRRI